MQQNRNMKFSFPSSSGYVIKRACLLCRFSSMNCWEYLFFPFVPDREIWLVVFMVWSCCVKMNRLGTQGGWIGPDSVKNRACLRCMRVAQTSMFFLFLFSSFFFLVLFSFLFSLTTKRNKEILLVWRDYLK